MLNAFASLNCSKKCQHNVQKPIERRLNARRCKISFFVSNTLWVGENRKIERRRLQLNLASLLLHGSLMHIHYQMKIVLYEVVKSVFHQTPTEAGAWASSEGLFQQYFDVSCYIVQIVLYNLIQTVVFDKCNFQFPPCTLPLQFLIYSYFHK